LKSSKSTQIANDKKKRKKQKDSPIFSSFKLEASWNNLMTKVVKCKEIWSMP
jgi:hypothetical protein